MKAIAVLFAVLIASSAFAGTMLKVGDTSWITDSKGKYRIVITEVQRVGIEKKRGASENQAFHDLDKKGSKFQYTIDKANGKLVPVEKAEKIGFASISVASAIVVSTWGIGSKLISFDLSTDTAALSITGTDEKDSSSISAIARYTVEKL